jgi:1-deoxy-D-xylulose-5-phosphate synthase
MPTMPQYALLNTIDSPADLRRLSRDELPAAGQQLRDFVLHSVSQTGGHLSSATWARWS